MTSRLIAVFVLVLASPCAWAQQSNPPPAGAPSSAPQPSPQKKSKDFAQKEAAAKEAAAESALQTAVSNAGNDRAALVRNLKDYLQHYPDAPRKAEVFRALVESCRQLHDTDCALDYAERLVAVQPDDYEMMMIAVAMLQQKGDDASLTRASGYLTRVIDRIEKETPDDRSARDSLAEWQQQQNETRCGLYYLRGNIAKKQGDLDLAVKDLQTSYSIVPNSLAAKELGEIAELKHDNQRAADEYLLAFVLPEDGPAGKVNRRDVRMSLGNVWRQVHGSDAGLGDSILAAYDRLAPAATSPESSAKNKSAKSLYDFMLRGTDGKTVTLANEKGKVLVLSFWATWCGPCRIVEPEVRKLAKAYAGNPDPAFLAVNTDEDETRVPPFLASVKWDLPIAYADGLDDFLGVESLPTMIVVDRSGNISYRANGLDPATFPSSLEAAIQSALGNSPTPAPAAK
jgi:thiol-disulfide isomerase/thioredoxin/tetratricopeptide (TPR) repeat protein